MKLLKLCIFKRAHSIVCNVLLNHTWSSTCLWAALPCILDQSLNLPLYWSWILYVPYERQIHSLYGVSSPLTKVFHSATPVLFWLESHCESKNNLTSMQAEFVFSVKAFKNNFSITSVSTRIMNNFQDSQHRRFAFLWDTELGTLPALLCKNAEGISKLYGSLHAILVHQYMYFDTRYAKCQHVLH